MCQGNSSTFFITTVNEELVSLIQLVSEMFELSFDTQGNGKCHVKFEFDYDFEKFFTNTNTNFHDILLRSSRIMISARAQHFLREFRKLFSLPVHDMLQGCEVFEKTLPIGLFHMDNVEADIEFDSFEGEQQY